MPENQINIFQDTTRLPVSEAYMPLYAKVAEKFGYVPGGSQTPIEAIIEWHVQRRSEFRNRVIAGIREYFGEANQEAIEAAIADFDANILNTTTFTPQEQ